MDGIVEDILHNEEFLAQSIHVEITEAPAESAVDPSASSTLPALDSTRIVVAGNYEELLEVQRRLVERFCFPLTFDNVLPFFKDFDRLKCCAATNTYISSSATEDPLASHEGVRDSVFGKGVELQRSAVVEYSVFGVNARIGERV